MDFHLYLQWTARLQLDAVQRRSRALGMPIGLFVDLALGADAGGAEVWGDQNAFAMQVSCGAPPDEFNRKGQDWGLPPYSPRALRAARYRQFIDLLRANMPEGGALRMDHALSLMRLWWIPRVATGLSHPEKGGYIHYPLEELVAVLARESRARRCIVIGEDLGTVSPELRKVLNEAGVLSYRLLISEKTPDGEFARPEAYPRDALTCVSTHDLPTWKGFLEARDLNLRKQLGLTADFETELRQREADKQRLKRALQLEGLDASAESAHLFLARTPCKIMMVQPEDVLQVSEQPNLPGTVSGHPNWRRKLPLLLERWGADARMKRLAFAMAPLRGSASRSLPPQPSRIIRRRARSRVMPR